MCYGKKMKKEAITMSKVKGSRLLQAKCPFCGKMHSKLTVKKCEHFNHRVDNVMHFQSEELQ